MPAAAASLTLRINPHYTSILSLYVVLLLLDAPAGVALRLRRPVPVLVGASFSLYVAG